MVVYDHLQYSQFIGNFDFHISVDDQQNSYNRHREMTKNLVWLISVLHYDVSGDLIS